LAQIGHIWPKRATLEMGSASIDKDCAWMSPVTKACGLENDVRAIDGSLDLAVDNYPLSLNGTVDERLG
jgi:hypothetical protein